MSIGLITLLIKGKFDVIIYNKLEILDEMRFRNDELEEIDETRHIFNKYAGGYLLGFLIIEFTFLKII